ncbi:MAG TPA: sigma factor [Dermatophilaceae bacterium]|nr:sigma factor [Dermatophilaceae bacterium]
MQGYLATEDAGNLLRGTEGLKGMKSSPPVGFVDFVVARGFALHRTAVLLTRQEQAAEDLVQIALAKAWQSWSRIDGNHEAYVRQIMVNEFASSWRRRWRGEVPTAEAMGTSVGTVKSQTSKALATLRVCSRLREETPPQPNVTEQAPQLNVTEQEGMLR